MVGCLGSSRNNAGFLIAAFNIEEVEKSNDPRIKLGIAGGYQVQANKVRWVSPLSLLELVLSI